MHQAIRTTYHGPTDTKGSRFTARANGGSITVSYDYSLAIDRNHVRAAEALALKLEWAKDSKDFRRLYVGGCFGDDYYFVDRKGGSLRHIDRFFDESVHV